MTIMINEEYTVILIGPYSVRDRTNSMNTYVNLLHRELTERGVSVVQIRPPKVLGALPVRPQLLRKPLFYIDKLVIFPFLLLRSILRCKKKRVPYLVHMCNQPDAIYTLLLRAVPHLVTCHDAIAIRAALGLDPLAPMRGTAGLYQKILPWALNRAKHVVAVSKTTKEQLREITTLEPSQITVIYNGPHFPYSPMAPDESLSRIRALLNMETLPSYYLHVGTNVWYKNRIGALRIYNALREASISKEIHFVMVGSPLTEELESFILNNDLIGMVQCFTNIDCQDLRALYSRAEALIFPSLREGFGWPIIEAQLCGCTVVTSNRDPMREVAGTGAILINPEEPEAAADMIIKNKASFPDLRANGQRNAQRFSKDVMIAGYLSLYRKLLDEKPMHCD